MHFVIEYGQQMEQEVSDLDMFNESIISIEHAF